MYELYYQAQSSVDIMLFHGILYTLEFFFIMHLTHEQELRNGTLLENYGIFAHWSLIRGCEGLLWKKCPPAVSPLLRSMFWEQSTSNLERRGISIEMDGPWGSWEVTGQTVHHGKTV